MTRTRMRLTITVFMNTCKPVSPLAAGTPYEWNTRILLKASYLDNYLICDILIGFWFFRIKRNNNVSFIKALGY